MPELKRFDAYEIWGIKDDGENCEPIHEKGITPDYHSLYGHIPEEGLQCIGDFKKQEDAVEVWKRITGEDGDKYPLHKY